MLEPGQRIDERYEVEALVGQGGLAEVYRVRHVQLGSLHALKLLLFRKKSLADRLLLEGRIQAQLNHPNVVGVTDVVRHEGQYALLMEYIDDLSLEDLLEERERFPVEEALELFAPVLAGVHAAHLAGVLHRDLKPSNVLLARHRGGLVPKVADFGIAKVVAEQLEGATAEGVAMGTPGYMAPEQVVDASSVDVRTDVFALAAILYELVTGRRAFAADDGTVSLRSTLEGTFRPMSSIIEDVPIPVCLAVQKALSREREDRFPSVLDLARALFADRPDVLASIEGTGVSRPISLDPDTPVRTRGVSGPGTAIEFGGVTEDPPSVETVNPTLTPLSVVGGDTVVADGPPPLGPDTAEASTVVDVRRRRSVPPFWTGAGLTVGALLVLGVLAVLVVGPGLGWRLAGPAASERQPLVVRVQDTTAAPAPLRAPSLPVAATRAPEPIEGAHPPAPEPAVRPETVAVQPVPGPSREPTRAAPRERRSSGPEAPAAVDPVPVTTTDSPPEAGGPDPAGEGAEAPSVVEPVPVALVEPLAAAPPPVMAMDVFLATSWSGKVFRQPFTLRDLSSDAGQVRATGEFIQGALRRTYTFAGTFEPKTGVLALRQVNGDLVIEGQVTEGSIRGLYRREGKGASPLLLTRQ